MIKINKAKLAGFTPLDKKYQTGFTPLDKKYQTGFTLIELIVSIAIIALISGILLANINYSNKPGELNMAAQKLASDIRLVQSYALGLKEFGGSRPDGGWGIFISKINPNDDHYVIYADTDNDHVCDSNCNSSSNEDWQDIEIQKGIKITGIKIDGSARNRLHFNFEPPNPAIWICRNAAQCNVTSDGLEAEITLSDASGNFTKIIKVNIFGLVDVEN